MPANGVRPGPIKPWGSMPQVGPGVLNPLAHGFPWEIETPDIQREGIGELVTFRMWGFPVGHIPAELRDEHGRIKPPVQWPEIPPWGIGDHTPLLDDYDKHQNPAESVEVVRSFDVQRCIDVDPAAITPAGVAFELVRYPIGTSSVGIVERVPTMFEVTALDGQGDPLFTFGSTNGERPCVSSLVHPTVGVGALTWQWRIVATHNPTQSQPAVVPLAGPVTLRQVLGVPLIPSWTDLRYGNVARWGDRNQVVVPARTMVSYWVILFGASDRFRVNVGSRLAGYWQSAGRLGQARDAATARIV